MTTYAVTIEFVTPHSLQLLCTTLDIGASAELQAALDAGMSVMQAEAEQRIADIMAEGKMVPDGTVVLGDQLPLHIDAALSTAIDEHNERLRIEAAGPPDPVEELSDPALFDTPTGEPPFPEYRRPEDGTEAA